MKTRNWIVFISALCAGALTLPAQETNDVEQLKRQLQEMLEVVVTDGTARASKLDGYRAAGKTGTAQKIGENGRYSNKYVASFAGYAPARGRRYAPAGTAAGGRPACW